MSEKKFTNLDRICAMSKEQMAELLSGCDIDKAGIKFCGEGGACPHTKECDDGKYPGCVYMDESKSLKEIQSEMWLDWLTMEWDDAPELPKMDPRLSGDACRSACGELRRRWGRMIEGESRVKAFKDMQAIINARSGPVAADIVCVGLLEQIAGSLAVIADAMTENKDGERNE